MSTQARASYVLNEMGVKENIFSPGEALYITIGVIHHCQFIGNKNCSFITTLNRRAKA